MNTVRIAPVRVMPPVTEIAARGVLFAFTEMAA
jgi:hypothetical protein